MYNTKFKFKIETKTSKPLTPFEKVWMHENILRSVKLTMKSINEKRKTNE